MKIYVGNLPFGIDDDALLKLFQEYGEVESAKVIVDRYTGRSRGFGFVEMSDADGARKAIETVNGQDVEGRSLTVNEARPRDNRQRGGGD